MATLVKVRKWGNSLGLRIPKTFATERAIVDGATLEIDHLKIADTPGRRRSRYKLKDILKNYARPPTELDFPRAGRESA
ncbi:MAG: AbrB/MazE/SpoVT family DNA-binding domain-containing protein [Tepidisphaeraceae bacterium]|jgi:antitoxin component of MazEF toxin-antitoxin module